MEVGIEHLMTGFSFFGPGASSMTFYMSSPSIFSVVSDEQFSGCSKVTHGCIDARKVNSYKPPPHCGIEHYAKVVSEGLREVDERSSRMHLYKRRGNEYMHRDGTFHAYAEGEPQFLPWAVMSAMRRKHGEEADKFMAKLKWAGDHWFYTLHRMYVGVEPDGHIHT
jgi:hypothetical protein